MKLPRGQPDNYVIPNVRSTEGSDEEIAASEWMSKPARVIAQTVKLSRLHSGTLALPVDPSSLRLFGMTSRLSDRKFYFA